MANKKIDAIQLQDGDIYDIDLPTDAKPSIKSLSATNITVSTISANTITAKGEITTSSLATDNISTSSPDSTLNITAPKNINISAPSGTVNIGPMLVNAGLNLSVNTITTNQITSSTTISLSASAITLSSADTVVSGNFMVKKGNTSEGVFKIDMGASYPTATFSLQGGFNIYSKYAGIKLESDGDDGSGIHAAGIYINTGSTTSNGGQISIVTGDWQSGEIDITTQSLSINSETITFYGSQDSSGRMMTTVSIDEYLNQGRIAVYNTLDDNNYTVYGANCIRYNPGGLDGRNTDYQFASLASKSSHYIAFGSSSKETALNLDNYARKDDYVSKNSVYYESPLVSISFPEAASASVSNCRVMHIGGVITKISGTYSISNLKKYAGGQLRIRFSKGTAGKNKNGLQCMGATTARIPYNSSVFESSTTIGISNFSWEEGDLDDVLVIPIYVNATTTTTVSFIIL